MRSARCESTENCGRNRRFSCSDLDQSRLPSSGAVIWANGGMIGASAPCPCRAETLILRLTWFEPIAPRRLGGRHRNRKRSRVHRRTNRLAFWSRHAGSRRRVRRVAADPGGDDDRSRRGSESFTVGTAGCDAVHVEIRGARDHGPSGLLLPQAEFVQPLAARRASRKGAGRSRRLQSRSSRR
jgi:hypothetical protein